MNQLITVMIFFCLLLLAVTINIMSNRMTKLRDDMNKALELQVKFNERTTEVLNKLSKR